MWFEWTENLETTTFHVSILCIERILQWWKHFHLVFRQFAPTIERSFTILGLNKNINLIQLVIQICPGGTSRCQDRWHYAAETWIKDNEHNFLLHLSWCLVWCGLMALNEHALLDMVQFIMPLFDNSEHALLDMVQFRQQSNFLAFRNPLQLRPGV